MSLWQTQLVAQIDPQQVEEVEERLDFVTSQLSQKLTDVAARDVVLVETQTATDMQRVLDLREVVTLAQAQDPIRDPAWADILGAMDAVDVAIRGELREEGSGPPTRVEAYFPVAAHRQHWDGSDNLLLLAAPLDENDVPEELIAYSVAEQSTVVISASEIPDTPTLVLGIGEHSAEELAVLPPQTLEAASAAPAQDGSIAIAAPDTRIGLPWVLITSDSEPWYKGDPELYVRVTQWFLGQQLQTKTKHLSWVNDTYKWYWLGDVPGTLYYPFTASYGSRIRFEFKEDDSWPDGDDHMGTLNIYRHEVPACGDYRDFAAKYMRVFADID
jgi:hypothetical protein